MAARLTEKTRALLSSETGCIKKSWDGKITVALVYANRYYTGMPNLGFQTLYRLLNEPQDVVCERFFLPDQEDELEYRRTGSSLLSLESQRRLSDFFLIAFSISFENDYPNVLKILELGRIPLLRQQRGEYDPLVMAGGIAVTLNPEPLSDFMDLFAIGEGEVIVPELLDALRDARNRRYAKEGLLDELSRIEGVYVPSRYDVRYDRKGCIEAFIPKGDVSPRIRRRLLSPIDEAEVAASTVISPQTAFGDMFLMEVSRGCPRGCRFCAAGYLYRPPRHRALSRLTETAAAGLALRKKVGLIAPSVCDYPHLKSLGESILKASGTISLTSLRLDNLDEGVLELLKKSGHKTVTIAPEAGSERLRKIIGKPFGEDDIKAAVELLVRHRIPNLRLYFMIGLPTETEEDVEEIIRLVKRLRHLFLVKQKGKGRLGRITVSVSPFVPKPSTPFQWHPFEQPKRLKERIKILQRAFRSEQRIRLIYDLPKWSYIQAMLSRGDRKIGQVLLASHSLHGRWNEAFRAVNVNPDFYITRQREEEEIFPWDFIDHGFEKGLLWREYKKALSL